MLKPNKKLLVTENVFSSEGVEELEFEPKIIKTEKFEIKPMFIDEAAMQMDLSEDAFKVFLNAQTERVNVIYRRADGNYGLIEPNF